MTAPETPVRFVSHSRKFVTFLALSSAASVLPATRRSPSPRLDPSRVGLRIPRGAVAARFGARCTRRRARLVRATGPTRTPGRLRRPSRRSTNDAWSSERARPATRGDTTPATRAPASRGPRTGSRAGTTWPKLRPARAAGNLPNANTSCGTRRISATTRRTSRCVPRPNPRRRPRGCPAPSPPFSPTRASPKPSEPTDRPSDLPRTAFRRRR